jgi:hypothetical protein
MFDLPFSIPSKTQKTGLPPSFLIAVVDHGLPFALTMAAQVPAAMMSGQARLKVLDRFATLAEAMRGAIDYAEHVTPDDAPQILAILDRDERLVLAGAASDGAVSWCHPVANAAEARAVVREASALRGQSLCAADWCEPDFAQRLRHSAELFEARLVDPLWRAFSARALQIAA